MQGGRRRKVGRKVERKEGRKDERKERRHEGRVREGHDQRTTAHNSRRVRSHVIGIVDFILPLSLAPFLSRSPFGPPRRSLSSRSAIQLPSFPLALPSSSSHALDQSLPLASLPLPFALSRARTPPPLATVLPLFVVTATHARSRGYVVEPPRGHRIIIGWQVTRTLSPGFNWPIIVARIDGAAGPDRRETFGVACSPSDTTRLSVTNISWQ